jgi:ATP-dependent Clp protease ATP-binding subunit ClpA
MFQRLTDRAAKVMALANSQAQRSRSDTLEAEHILLGLVEEGKGVGASMLKNLGVDLDRVRSGVRERLGFPSAVEPASGKRPAQQPMAKRVLERAISESQALGHDHAGTEHLLLGLLSVKGSIPEQVLGALGVDLDRARGELLAMLGTKGGSESGEELAAKAMESLSACLQMMSGAAGRPISLEALVEAIFAARRTLGEDTSLDAAAKSVLEFLKQPGGAGPQG